MRVPATSAGRAQIYDARIGSSDWDTPRGLGRGGDWVPAARFHNAGQLGQGLELLAMPPIAVTDETAPVTIKRVVTVPSGTAEQCHGQGAGFLVADLAEGDSATLRCAAGGTIKTIEFASFGVPAFSPPRGRFVKGSVPGSGKCGDPKFVPGCIFWEDAATNRKHFVRSCTVQPCGVDACGPAVPVGAAVKGMPTGADFNCSNLLTPCGATGAVAKGGCDDPASAAKVAKACVGEASCTLTADPTAFADACGDGTHRGRRRLIVVASGCTPAATTKAVYVADFGQNQVGFARINKVRGARGSTVVLKYAEVLNPDGTAKMDWCGGKEGHDCVCTGINCANQTDSYTLSGAAGGETYNPSFTYHGFRYVQVEGWPGPDPPTASSLTAMFVHSAVKKTGDVKFNDSLAILNGIQKAYVYTQLSNMHSHPTDCPTREKRGWTGDSQLTSGGAALNFAALGFYGNWLGVMADHQAVNCALHKAPPVFPQANVDVCCDPPNNGFGCDYTGLAGGRFNDTAGALADVIPFTHVGGWPGDPGWMLAGVVINWENAMKSGDVQFARDHYQTSKALVDFMSRHVGPTGLVEWGYYGDWLSLEGVPHPQVTGWHHILGVSRLRDLANLTQQHGEYAHYAAYLATLKARYHATFFDTTRGCYAGGSQTAQILPLYLGIPPPGAAASVAKALVDDLAAHGNTTTAGIVGTAYLMQVLEVHAPALALAIATSTAKPSLGYMVEQGPGTIWESWTDTTNSHNHPALSASFSKYLYSLAGIALEDPDVWTKRRFRVFVHPQVAALLRSANGTVETTAGTLTTSWTMDDGAGRPGHTATANATAMATLEVSVPMSMEAELHVPVPPRCDPATVEVVEAGSGARVHPRVPGDHSRAAGRSGALACPAQCSQGDCASSAAEDACDFYCCTSGQIQGCVPAAGDCTGGAAPIDCTGCTSAGAEGVLGVRRPPLQLAGVRALKRSGDIFRWGGVCFLISLGSPHVRPMGRTCGEPNVFELTAAHGVLNGLSNGCLFLGPCAAHADGGVDGVGPRAVRPPRPVAHLPVT